MNHDEERLVRLIEASRDWIRAPRVLDVVRAAGRVLADGFGIDAGAFVFARPALLPHGEHPEPPLVRYAWGCAAPDGAAQAPWLPAYVALGFEDAPHAGVWVPKTLAPAELARHMEAYGFETAGHWPVSSVEGLPRGAFVLARRRPGPDDADLITAAVHHIELVIRLTAARRRAETTSLTDPLTGLWNRRGILTHVPAFHEEAQRRGEAFVVAVLDVNGMKAINDRYGHAAGDRVLVTVARALVDAMRRGDMVGRWGGDEFVALLATRHPDVGRIARRLTQAVGVTEFGGSLSAGAAVFGADGEAFETVLAKADARCYQAKRRRRAL